MHLRKLYGAVCSRLKELGERSVFTDLAAVDNDVIFVELRNVSCRLDAGNDGSYKKALKVGHDRSDGVFEEQLNKASDASFIMNIDDGRTLKECSDDEGKEGADTEHEAEDYSQHVAPGLALFADEGDVAVRDENGGHDYDGERQ